MRCPKASRARKEAQFTRDGVTGAAAVSPGPTQGANGVIPSPTIWREVKHGRWRHVELRPSSCHVWAGAVEASMRTEAAGRAAPGTLK